MMNPLRPQHKFRIIGIILLMCLFLLSCGSSEGEDSSPGGNGNGGTTTTNISVSASSQNIVADGTSQTAITATVTDSGGTNIADGTQVTFSTTAGSLSAASAATAGGIASVTLTSPLTIGSATVTASSQGASGTVTVNFTAGPIANITLSAAPNNLNANGTSTSTIQALATDANGNPANDGELISFSIASGSGSLSNPSATTSGGSASVTYTASNTPGIETIQAQAASGVSATTNITLVTATAGSVSLSAGTSSLVADGVSFTMLRATVLDSVGNNVSDGTVVTFTTTAGDLDGATPGNQTTINASTVNGVATAQLTSATTIGSATTTATVSGRSDTTVITFTPGPVAVVSLTATPNNLTADGISTSTIRAMVLDANANPVANGETILFSLTGGGTLSALSGTTTGGVVSITYTASDMVGTETIQARATNGVTSSVNITLIAATVGNVAIAAGSSSIVANGVDSTLITASVTDIGGNVVADGTVVNFAATAGALSSTSATTTNGVASVILTSSTMLGSAMVTATAGSVSGNTTVSFVPGPPSAIALTANPANITADGVSTSTVRAVATDANGNPVADGQTINFAVTAGGGTLSSFSALTSGGVATVTYIAANTAGTATVQASAATGATASTNITLVAATVGTVTATAGSAGIVADGASATVITATVADSGGNPIADGTTVNFTATAGTLSAASAATANGTASVILTSATSLGTATVTATAGGVSDTVSVDFTAGAPNAVSVAASPSNLTADGAGTSTIRATVTDANGNPASGQTVNFTVASGSLSAVSTTTDQNGTATVIYTAPAAVPAGGTDTVTAATANGTSGSATINLIAATVGNVAVSAATTNIVANGTDTTLITATVTDTGGNPILDGTTVSFAATAGTLSAASANTSNGIASVILTSPAALGSATVTATSGGVSGTTSVTFTAGPASTVAVSATPTNLTADGSATSTVRATVADANGNPVSGETVSFAATIGVLSAASVQTDIFGTATVTFTAPNSTGSATITAITSNQISTTETITLVAAQVGSISLAAGSSSLPADNTSTTLITATVRDPSGNPVSDGTTVDFSTTEGSLSAASANTSGGNASVILTSSAVLGSALIDATSGGVSSTTSVNFVAGPPAAVSVSASPNNLTADGASTSLLTVLVADSGGNPVNGESVSFAATSGSLSDSSVQTDITGVARVTYTAPSAVGAGTATVTVTTTNNITDTVSITLVDAQVGAITISLGSASIPADGISTTLITATVTDTGGNTIADGTTVNFSTTAGTLSADSADTFGGNASVILTSATTVGPSLITATSGGVSSSTTVSFTAGAADAANTTLSASPGVIAADGASSSLVTLAAADANGNPVVDGTRVDFTTTAGSLSAAAASTTNGRATVNLTSSTSNETAVVTAFIDTVTKTVSVVFGTGAGSGEPANIIISVNPESIQVQGTGGVSRTTITATVVDENGEPYNDSSDNIRFRLQSGLNGGEYIVDASGNPQSTITKSTSGGIAAVSLQAGTASGPVTILVEVLKDGSGTLLGTPTTAVSPPILIEPGAPFSMTLFPASDVIDNANGTLSQIFAAMLQDRQGNPVADGTGVYFGIVDNPPNGYLSNGDDGETTADFDVFTSFSTNFSGDSVTTLDRLIILEGRDEGGHLIESAANQTVDLIYNLKETDTDLDFVAGNAQLGNICTVVPTGNLIPDTTCTPATGTAVKGVAHSRLTWSEPGISKPFYLYAESADPDLSLGQALSSTYGSVGP